jgi:adenosylhomocysteine nucleosidase
VDDGLPLIAAAGLDFEAEAARGLGVKVVSGLEPRRYLEALHAEARAGASGIISFGVAGGLCPHLNTGDAVIASAVLTGEGSYETCKASSAALLAALPQAVHLPVFGATGPVLTPAEKEAIWKETGAATVDVESRYAAEVAAHHGLPYTVLRVVLDPAHRQIPLCALSGVDGDGNTCPAALFKALSRRPGDLPGLLRIAAEGRKAALSLMSIRRALGPCFGLLAPEPGVFEDQMGGLELAQAKPSYSAQFRAAADNLVLIRTWFARRAT